MNKPKWLRIRTRGRFRARMDVYARIKRSPGFKVVELKSTPLETFEEAAEVAQTLSRQHRQLGEVWQGRTFICNVNGMSKASGNTPKPKTCEDTPCLYTLDDEAAMVHDIRTAMACSFGESDGIFVESDGTPSLNLDPDYVNSVEDSVLS